MGLARGRGRGKGRGGIFKPKNRGPAIKPPPLLGHPAPPPGMALRPRGLPVPPLLPRMRLPPPGIRSPRIAPHPPPMLGPGRPIPPPFHPPPPPHPPPHVAPLPPPLPLRPPLPPPSLLRARGQRVPPPLPLPGVGYGAPVPLRGKFGGRRGGGIVGRGGKRKGNPKKNEQSEDSEINKPWVTDAMKTEIQKKHKLFQKAKKTNAQSDWDEFKDQRNRVTTMIREAKLEYIGSHPEEDVDKIMAEVNSKEKK